MIAFGPVPSRRLGQSLGVNHIPHKICTYACTYCQVGPTLQMRVQREHFFTTPEIVAAVGRKLAQCDAAGEKADYISFVPDGEPTLDARLGGHIRAVAELGTPVAVITNSSLLWDPAVRAELSAADLVSVKVDSVLEPVWRALDRPHGQLDLDRVLDGIRAFAGEFNGTLISETMLVRGVNDDAAGVEAVAEFLSGIEPDCAYLSGPTRPPACADVLPPDDASLVRAHDIMSARLPRAELLQTFESSPFTPTGDRVEGLLDILAVHPMRERAVHAYLEGDPGDESSLVERLVREGRIRRVEYGGEPFFLRCHPRDQPAR